MDSDLFSPLHSMGSSLQMGPDMDPDPQDITASMSQVPGGQSIQMQDEAIMRADAELTRQEGPRQSSERAGFAEELLETPTGKLLLMAVGIWLMMGLLDLMRN